MKNQNLEKTLYSVLHFTLLNHHSLHYHLLVALLSIKAQAPNTTNSTTSPPRPAISSGHPKWNICSSTNEHYYYCHCLLVISVCDQHTASRQEHIHSFIDSFTGDYYFAPSKTNNTVVQHQSLRLSPLLTLSPPHSSLSIPLSTFTDWPTLHTHTH